MNIGIDVIEISRIKKSISNPRFLSRMFSPSELKFFSEISFNPATIATSFCAKEAFAKAMGTGFRGFCFKEISVLRDVMGTPYLSLTGKAKSIFNSTARTMTVSVSHSRTIATAVVIAVKK